MMMVVEGKGCRTGARSTASGAQHRHRGAFRVTCASHHTASYVDQVEM
jgi:hypothetical protein